MPIQNVNRYELRCNWVIINHKKMFDITQNQIKRFNRFNLFIDKQNNRARKKETERSKMRFFSFSVCFHTADTSHNSTDLISGNFIFIQFIFAFQNKTQLSLRALSWAECVQSWYLAFQLSRLGREFLLSFSSSKHCFDRISMCKTYTTSVA